MYYKIKIILNSNDGHSEAISIKKKNNDIISIGRSGDLVITGQGISKKHCQIEMYEEKLLVTDLESTNGTFLNGKKVEVEEIKLGDKITVGDATLLIQAINDEELEAEVEKTVRRIKGSTVKTIVGLCFVPIVFITIYFQDMFVHQIYTSNLLRFLVGAGTCFFGLFALLLILSSIFKYSVNKKTMIYFSSYACLFYATMFYFEVNKTKWDQIDQLKSDKIGISSFVFKDIIQSDIVQFFIKSSINILPFSTKEKILEADLNFKIVSIFSEFTRRSVRERRVPPFVCEDQWHHICFIEIIEETYTSRYSDKNLELIYKTAMTMVSKDFEIMKKQLYKYGENSNEHLRKKILANKKIFIGQFSILERTLELFKKKGSYFDRTFISDNEEIISKTHYIEEIREFRKGMREFKFEDILMKYPTEDEDILKTFFFYFKEEASTYQTVSKIFKDYEKINANFDQFIKENNLVNDYRYLSKIETFRDQIKGFSTQFNI